MKVPLRSRIATVALFPALLLAQPASARGQKHAVVKTEDTEISGYAEGVTDYRWRGISSTAGDFAIQGGLTISHSSGFYASVWASSLEDSDALGSTEVDFNGGWTGEVFPSLKADVGMYLYHYPNGNAGPADFLESYASLSTDVGPVNAKIGAAYAWNQASLGDQDNLYVYSEFQADVGNTPLSLTAHVGYTEGALSPNRLTETSDKGGFDYWVGASYNIYDNIYLSATYVGVGGAAIKDYSNDTVVGSIRYLF